VIFNRKLFEKQRKKYLEAIGKSNKLRVYSQKFNEIATDLSYVYQWDWLGEPILQSPSDMIVIQEKIFEIKPDIIVETGVAWGGSILFYATILDSINKGKVIGIDLNLDKKIVNKLKNKKFSKRIELIKNNSLSKDIDKKLENEFKKKKKIMVILDSYHTHEHVLDELNFYSRYVSKKSYIIVCDTILNFIGGKIKGRKRPWDSKKNPMTAVEAFLKNNKNFVIDKDIDKKLFFSCNQSGYLKKIK